MRNQLSFLFALALACNASEQTPADEEVCEGDQFVGDAATQAQVADCARVSGNLVFTGNELVHVELPKLSRVDGNFSVWGNPNLIEIKLSGLVRVGGYFLIEANDRLTSLDFPMLASVNERAVMHRADVSITGNPQLPTCQAHALRDQLQAHDFAGNVLIEENLGSCSE